MLTPEQIEARRAGIGGSDWQHILAIEPYGCPRLCWYDKRGWAPDFAKRETGAMWRGSVLEEPTAKLYEQRTGRRVRRVLKPKKAKGLPEWWLGLPDREILADGDECGRGELEIKTIDPWRWPKLAAGDCPDRWVAQLHHYMVQRNRGWGDIAMLEPVFGRLHIWGLTRDPELARLMLDAGARFWAQVENGPAPDRLDPSDRRCRECPWRMTCQGEALEVVPEKGDLETSDDAELAALLTQRAEIKAVADDASAELKRVNAEIISRAGEGKRLQCGEFKLYTTVSIRETLDTKALRAEMPNVAARFARKSKSVSVKVYS